MSLRDFVTGVAVLIDGAGIGAWQRTPTTGQPVITFQDIPTSPDLIIALTAYFVADQVELNDSMVALQVRTRGDDKPSTAMDLDEAIFNLIHGLHDLTIGGVWVGLLRRVSSMSGPKDANGRFERTSNYYASTAMPSANRPD